MKKFKAFKKDDKVWAQAINPYEHSEQKYNGSAYSNFDIANPPILSPSLTDGEVYSEEDLELGYVIEPNDDLFYLKKEALVKDMESEGLDVPIIKIARLKQPKESEQVITNDNHANSLDGDVLPLTEQASSTEKEESLEESKTPKSIKIAANHYCKQFDSLWFGRYQAYINGATDQKQQTQKAIDALVEKWEARITEITAELKVPSKLKEQWVLLSERMTLTTVISDLKNLSK